VKHASAGPSVVRAPHAAGAEEPRKRLPTLATPAPKEAPKEKTAREEAAGDAPRASGSEGYLRLGSKPWTKIAIDGRDTGQTTPQPRLRLPAGTHRVTLTNPQFGIAETFAVEIRAGETETVVKDLRPKTAPAPQDE
jgi:hypothetical protein